MDKAGIREVAKAAGVSISTVSRAFAHPEVVSEKTRHKVLQAADQLDFNISRSAAALKSGQEHHAYLPGNTAPQFACGAPDSRRGIRSPRPAA